MLKWQAGLFVFTQNYDQEAVNSFAPFLLSPFLGFPVSQHSPQSALDDIGVGVYGQGTLTFVENLDLTVGARVDHESKEALLETFYTPEVAPPTVVSAERSFSNVSPQVGARVSDFSPAGWRTCPPDADSRRAASTRPLHLAARPTTKN